MASSLSAVWRSKKLFTGDRRLNWMKAETIFLRRTDHMGEGACKSKYSSILADIRRYRGLKNNPGWRFSLGHKKEEDAFCQASSFFIFNDSIRKNYRLRRSCSCML